MKTKVRGTPRKKSSEEKQENSPDINPEVSVISSGTCLGVRLYTSKLKNHSSRTIAERLFAEKHTRQKSNRSSYTKQDPTGASPS